MTETEYRTKVISLEAQIEYNKRIRCKRVAARYQRMLDELEEAHETEMGETEVEEEEQEQSLLDGDVCDETTE